MPRPLQGSVGNESSPGIGLEQYKIQVEREGAAGKPSFPLGERKLRGFLAAVWGKIPERDHLSPSQVWKVIISRRDIYRPHPALGHQPESLSHQSISCGFESGCFSLLNLHCILYGSSESASPSPWSDPLSQCTNSGLLLCQTPTEFIMKPFSHLKEKILLPYPQDLGLVLREQGHEINLSDQFLSGGYSSHHQSSVTAPSLILCFCRINLFLGGSPSCAWVRALSVARVRNPSHLA